MIGIIGAMDVEVNLLLETMKNTETEIFSNIKYNKGIIEGKEVVVAVAGIGKVNAAICTQTMILKYKPSLVINTGVAGGIGKNLKIGDVVIADYVLQHDMDTSPVGDPVGFISGINLVEIPCHKETSYKILDIANKITHHNTYIGTIATGDKFINNKIEANNIAEKFNAIACEMEGGSIGHVCYVNNVDFCIIRSISDGGDDESDLDYGQFVLLAAENSKNLLIEYLKES
ncbi:MAG: 5'-methylthioadenosine/adenosylhomocysteine nucleosidase [Clostridiaceae bacterium]